MQDINKNVLFSDFFIFLFAAKFELINEQLTQIRNEISVEISYLRAEHLKMNVKFPILLII